MATRKKLATVPVTAGEQLEQAIRRYHQISDESKKLEREKEALREYFIERAAQRDCVFKSRDGALEVTVGSEEREYLDQKKIRLELGAKVAKYLKVTTSWIVKARKAKEQESA
jgi:DNA repair exonuclease SbcCD nuclease subunit